ncbi:MAG: TIGR03943 family protein [Cryobacterium sp.]
MSREPAAPVRALRSIGPMLGYFTQRWQGVLLTLVVVVATLWLGLTGQLGLYIHPRYFVFTLVMAAIGLVMVIAGFGLRDKFAVAPAGPLRSAWTLVGVVVLGAIGAATVVIPPTTLTSATASQREINSGGLATEADSEQAAALIGTGDFANLTVKEWVSLLAQSSDPLFYANKTVRVLGFVSPDANDPENVFYVARFVVTCCAVDAQPIGVPVYLPGWQSTLETDQWVDVTGVLAINPSTRVAEPLAIDPADITPVDRPADPYVY